MKLVAALALAAFALPLTSGLALSDSGQNNGQRLDPHVRFPNDIAYSFGTVSKRTGKKEPYIERCYWRAKPGTFVFKGLTQVCTRYTPENTE